LKFFELTLQGAYVIEPELIEDSRGFFARSFCIQEFQKIGLNPHINQCNISFNHKKGTLRGMHFQIGTKSEVKVVRCTMGSVYDVIIDLRPTSSTFKRWEAVELSARNRKMLYIPQGFAHGFQTLEDDSELSYQMSELFAPEYARGIRWNDPLFQIKWPYKEPAVISQRDREYLNFTL
jgi:dTDP-4-dehydrorhamnose 3,5-epimerase